MRLFRERGVARAATWSMLAGALAAFTLEGTATSISMAMHFEFQCDGLNRQRVLDHAAGSMGWVEHLCALLA